MKISSPLKSKQISPPELDLSIVPPKRNAKQKLTYVYSSTNVADLDKTMNEVNSHLDGLEGVHKRQKVILIINFYAAHYCEEVRDFLRITQIFI